LLLPELLALSLGLALLEAEPEAGWPVISTSWPTCDLSWSVLPLSV
jgi:hypothetical protein